MKLFPASLFIIATLVLFSACSGEKNSYHMKESANANSSTVSEVPPATKQAEQARTDTTTATTANASMPSGGGGGPVSYQKVSDKQVTDAQADQERASQHVAERKIIRNAELNLETENPAEGQRKIAHIAESHGGFVVNSDARQREDEDQTKPEMTATVTLRVPSDQFDQTVNEILGVGKRVRQNKITGQDVTEEYFDLEARIKAKKALEAQFMEIMKQARSVSDALEVQSQLAEVRTEIERLEGRHRYLDNQSSLSTITVTLSSPALLVSTNTTGFGNQLKRAFGGGVDIAAGITLFLIQAVLALLPVVILIFLPLGFLVRYLVRRNRRLQLARELVHDEK